MKEVILEVWSHVLCDRASLSWNIHCNEQNSQCIPCLMKIFVTMEKLFRGGPRPPPRASLFPALCAAQNVVGGPQS